MNKPQSAFGNPVEQLEGCQLSSPPTEAQAQVIAGMLAASEPWLSLKFSAAALAGYLTRDDAALRRFVVSVDGEVAGVICLRHPWLRGPYIELLGMSPAHRGKGLGRQVLAWAESEARREARNLWVLTSSFNQQAQDFYRSLGFLPIGTIEGLVSPEHDEILLRKVL
jgi:ribosomal protein S18 acetylase RimI-like enzyme